MAIDTPHPEYVASLEDWTRMRHTLAGQRTMRSNARDYLRRPIGMTDEAEWQRYVNGTEFFEATLRTLEGLTGLAFYRDPQITLPDGMSAFLADATQDGVPFRQFAEKIFEDVLAVARGCVLVDFPPPDPNVRTRRDEERVNRRAFVRRYLAEEFFNWEVSEVNGSAQLTEVRLFETETVKDGEWGKKTRRRIRVLQLQPSVANGQTTWTYVQRVFVHNDWETDSPTEQVVNGAPVPDAPGTGVTPAEDWIEQLPAIVPKIDGKPLDYIPFWIINPTDQSPSVVRPPMLALANTNIGHFKTTGQLENALFWSGNPQLYVAGADPNEFKELRVGSSEAWVFNNPQTKVDFASFGAEQLTPLEKRLDRLEQHMAVLGARMLSADARGVEAAETARIHRQGEISVLAGVCGSVSRAMTDIAVVATEWQALAATDVKMKIHTAFYDQVVSADDALKYMKLWQAGVIDILDLIALLQKGEIIAPEKTADQITANNQSSPIQPIIPALTVSSGGAPSAAK